MDDHTKIVLLAKLIIMGMVCQLMVVGYVLYTDYTGRNDAISYARAGCERDKRSRTADAQGWRIAQKARIMDRDFQVANQYGALARTLEETADIDCDKEYPKASLLP